MKDSDIVSRRHSARLRIHKVISIKQASTPGKTPIYTVNQFMVLWSLTGGTPNEVIHVVQTYVLGSLLPDYGNCGTKMCLPRFKPRESG